MQGKFSLLAVGGFCAISLLGGCGDSDSEFASSGTEALVAPRQEHPPMWDTVDSLTPSLTWSYPNLSRQPEGYLISLQTGPFFADELGGEVTGPSTSWSPAAPLQAGTEYAWSVEAVDANSRGPVAGYEYFFTGPSCAANTLKAPDLLSPEDGAVIRSRSPTLIWHYPDPCLPSGYAVNLSTSLDFEGSPLNGGTGTPSTRWGRDVPLSDCARYYWRVAAGIGAQFSEYSEVHTFRIDTSGGCPAE